MEKAPASAAATTPVEVPASSPATVSEDTVMAEMPIMSEEVRASVLPMGVPKAQAKAAKAAKVSKNTSQSKGVALFDKSPPVTVGTRSGLKLPVHPRHALPNTGPIAKST